MNKAELVKELERRLGSRRAAIEAVDAVLDVVIREVARGGRVAITGFGTFEKVDRAARTGRNPRTGEAVRIESTAVPRFKAGTAFKEVVADPSKLPTAARAGGRAPAAPRSAATRTAARARTGRPPGRPVPRAETRSGATRRRPDG